MKNKIMIRLSLYFFVSFIVFSFIIGIVFSVLFSRHNIKAHRAELERQAVSIASVLSEAITTNSNLAMGRGMGMRRNMAAMEFNTYMRLIEEIVVCSVWVIDRDLEQIVFTDRHQHMHMQIPLPLNPGELPSYAEQVIIDAFEGRSSTGESFSEFLGSPSITAAAPIVFQNCEIIGAVLLHSYVSNVEIINTEGITILMYSISGAVLMSVFVAAMLSSRFTNPLNKMKKAALRISGGDYSAQTGISQSDEIGELAATLDDMAGRLAHASGESAKLEKLRHDFVANISHELRTPITVIKGSLEALCDGVVTDTEKTALYHNQMLVETVHLERLVSDLLDLARLQNPDFAIEMQPVNLKDIMDDIVRSMSGLAERKEINLNYTHEQGDFMCMGDYGRLRQMFIIVLDNAIKFSASGQAVDITLAKKVSDSIITVHDKGCGISADDLPYIFERFYKQRSELNKSGSGLGLAIAKQIADRHEVFFDVISKQDAGTACTFTFKN